MSLLSRDLQSTIATYAAQTEADRELPAKLLTELTEAGLFRMFVPKSHGGLETDLMDGLRVLETLARADGSTGWTVMIGSESPQLLALLPRQRFDQIYAAKPDVIVAGGFNPQGAAETAEGGYVVSGRWNFASGSRHADWIFGNCVVTEGGKPAEIPVLRAMLRPAAQAQVLDTWHVLGLRGTGSDDFVLSGQWVPTTDTFDIFTGQPCVDGPLFVAPLVHFTLHLAAVAVGIAQGALDDMVTHAQAGKQRLYAKESLASSPVFHTHLGRAEMRVRSARALVHAVAAEFWQCATDDPGGAMALSPMASAALAWVTEQCVSTVDTCYRAAGGGAARDSSPLQRRFRDMHTFSQHAAVAEGWFARYSQSLLGAAPGLAY